MNRTWVNRAFVLAAFAAVAVLSSSCSGAQKKEGSGEVETKLRRVDIVAASFDEMQLSIVVLIDNGTSNDVSISSGEAKLRIAGAVEPHEVDEPEDDEADDDGEDDGEDDAEDEEADEEADDDDDDDVDDDDEDDEDDEDSGVDTSGIVTGEWVSGKAAGGSCAAFSECEVTIPVTLPLPKDTEALERLLGWQRMSVETKGSLRFGEATETFGGPREISTPVMPKVILEEAQIASVDDGEKGEAFLKVGLDNPNVFEVKVDSFEWGITVGGKVLRERKAGSWEKVPPSSVASFEDNVQLNEETFGKEVKQLLRQPSVSYVVDGKMVVRGIEREFTFEGEMEFAR